MQEGLWFTNTHFCSFCCLWQAFSCYCPAANNQPITQNPFNEIRLTNSSYQAKDNINVYCKLLTKKEGHRLFDGRGSRLLRKRKPIYPLYLSIENNSQRALILDPKAIGLKLINPELVAQRLYSHTSRRIVLPLILGSIGAVTTLYVAACISIIGAIGSIPAFIKAGYAGLGISGALAVGTPGIKVIGKDLMQSRLTMQFMLI